MRPQIDFPLFLSVAMHASLMVFAAVNLDLFERKSGTGPAAVVIQARAVDPRELTMTRAQIDERDAAELREAQRVATERKEEERLAQERGREDAERKEQERLEAERKEAERVAAAREETERLAAERKDTERQAAERKEKERLAAERKETERIAAERKEKERLEDERKEKQRLEAERKEKERLEAERKEKVRLEAERKEKARQAREAERRRAQAEREQMMQAEMDAELNRLALIDDGKMQEYVALIQQKIKRNWRRPPSAKDDLECRVRVQQIRGGDVVDVKMLKCNGDMAVQRSIEAAIYQASPLPEPPDPALFDRNLEIIFDP